MAQTPSLGRIPALVSIVSKESSGPIVPSRPWGVWLPLLRAREARGEGAKQGQSTQ